MFKVYINLLLILRCKTVPPGDTRRNNHETLFHKPEAGISLHTSFWLKSITDNQFIWNLESSMSVNMANNLSDLVFIKKYWYWYKLTHTIKWICQYAHNCINMEKELKQIHKHFTNNSHYKCIITLFSNLFNNCCGDRQLNKTILK